MRCLAAVLLFVTLVAPIYPQADSCRGALSALDRVKQEITPELGKDPSDTFGRDRLKEMFSTIESASRVCPDFAELFYYRSLIAAKLGDKREVTYSERKQKELDYKPTYNPFTPSAAQLVEAEGPPGPVRRKWALVVGINEFTDAEHIAPLKYAAKDSQDFAHFLTDTKGGGFEKSRVKTMTNSEATLNAFWEAFATIRAEAQPEDLVVIYLASHGSPREGDPNGLSFIMLHDSDMSGPVKMFLTSVEMVDLAEKLNREIKARRVVLFLDTCFSGDASTAGRESGGSRKLAPVWMKDPPATTAAGVVYSGGLQKLRAGGSRAVITASRADEVSWEGESFKNGYFTHFLLDSLRGGGKTLTLADLFPTLSSKVSESVKRDHPGMTQTPSGQFDGRSGGIVISAAEGIN